MHFLALKGLIQESQALLKDSPTVFKDYNTNADRDNGEMSKRNLA